MNQPLDHEPTYVENRKPCRLLTTLLEMVPLLMVFVGILLKNSNIIVISMSTLSFVFIGAGWFIFRKKKYTVGSVIFAVGTSIILASGVMALLFQILNWEGQLEIKTATIPMLVVGLVANVIWYLVNRHKGEEGGFSLKMLLRLIVFTGLLFYL